MIKIKKLLELKVSVVTSLKTRNIFGCHGL